METKPPETSTLPPPTEPMLASGPPTVVDLRHERTRLGPALLVIVIVLLAYVIAVGNQRMNSWMFDRRWSGSKSTMRGILQFPTWRFSPAHDATGFWVADLTRIATLIGLTVLLTWAMLRRLRPVTFGVAWLATAMATVSASVVASIVGQATIRLVQNDVDVLVRPIGELTFLLQSTALGAAFGLGAGVIVGFATAIAATIGRPPARAAIVPAPV